MPEKSNQSSFPSHGLFGELDLGGSPNALGGQISWAHGQPPAIILENALTLNVLSISHENDLESRQPTSSSILELERSRIRCGPCIS